jgi:hypothetical protein
MQGFAQVEIGMKAPKPEPHPGEKRVNFDSKLLIFW